MFDSDSFDTTSFDENSFDFGVAAASVALCSSSSTGTLFDSYVPVGGSMAMTALGYNMERTAQSFETSGDAITITGVCVQLRQIGSPTGTLTVNIKAHSGTYGTSSVPTGSSLVSSGAYDPSGISTDVGGALYWFPLSLALSASTPYTIEVDGAGLTGDSGNYIGVLTDGSSATHGGNKSQDNGSGYTAISTEDLHFKIYRTSSASGQGDGRVPQAAPPPGARLTSSEGRRSHRLGEIT